MVIFCDADLTVYVNDIRDFVLLHLRVLGKDMDTMVESIE